MNLTSYKKNLAKFVSIKSVSTGSFKGGIDSSVSFLKSLFEKIGFETSIIKGNKTNPYVFAEYKVSSKAETVLIYGHYDVQPADRKDGWESDPFRLVEKDGRLFARGVSDNKGQVLIHISTVAELIKSKKLTKNVKFLIEGNEETANDEIANVIRKNKKLLKCDYVLISDGELTNGRPSIDAGFRGGANVMVTFETAKNNVHSGLYGGAFPNAAMELSTLISKFYDSTNRVAITNFYKGVEKPSLKELKNNKSIDFNLEKIKKDTGVKSLKKQKGVDFFTQTGLYPMLTVTGFKSGYIDEGFNNIIPCIAEAKINFRFAASQKPKEMIKIFKDFVIKTTPDYVKVSFKVDSRFDPIKIDVTNPVYKKTEEILEDIYKDKIVYKYCGASIPVIVDFIRALEVPVLSVSLANEDCNMHGVDENFKIDLIKKGLLFSERFFS